MHIDLKFVRSWNAYNAGEVARFAAEIGEALVKKGIATLASPASPANAGETNGAAAGAKPAPDAGKLDDKAKPQGK
jgi:hypothetical protein